VFYQCSALVCVYLPNVEYIEPSGFNNCSSLRSIYLPNATRIDGYAFVHCQNLTSIYLPKVTYIGDFAFYNCSNLTSAYLPKVTDIGSSTFKYGPSITIYTTTTNTYIPSIISTKFPSGSTISTNLSSTNLSFFTINGYLASDNSAFTFPYGTTSVSVIAIPFDPSGNCAISGDTDLHTGNNIVTITVTDQNGATREYRVTIIVNQQLNQTFILDFTIPDKTYGTDLSFQLIDPSSNSDSTFLYVSSDATVATINGKIVTITGVGTSTIRAIQDATQIYESGSVTATLTVNKPTPNIGSLSITTQSYSPGGTYTITNPTTNSTGVFTYTSSDTSVASISGNIVTILQATTSPITIRATQAETTNYTSGSVTAYLSVNKGSPTIGAFAAIPDKTYAIDTSFALIDPSSDSSGAFTYTSSHTNVASISGIIVTIIGDGTTTITATQAETTNYNSGSKTTTLTVKPPPTPPSVTNILQNEIIGRYVPNSTVVITEKISNNEIITSQIQTNSQGTWNFRVTNHANTYAFAPLNIPNLSQSLTSKYSAKYPQNKYTLTTNSPVSIILRQYGTNEQDQRSFRISPKLPEGLKFSPITGVISGTPVSTMESTIYNIWSNSEVFLSYKIQLTIEIV